MTGWFYHNSSAALRGFALSQYIFDSHNLEEYEIYNGYTLDKILDYCDLVGCVVIWMLA
jgi:hypothetical protein